MANFKLVSDYVPQGDQPRAIKELSSGLVRGDKHQTLMGVTGSGKTYTMANVIKNYGRPALILSHNKTLAAQLYGEMRGFFPDNAVEYFISYYDYYQPEAYVATTDTFIEKDTSINDEIDRLRLKATSSLLSRNDVVIVASVSCIYGLGSPKDWQEMLLFLDKGQEIDRNVMLGKLIDIHYTRNDVSFDRGTFRVRGDVVEVIPAYEKEAVRIEMFGDEIENISVVDVLTGEVKNELDRVAIYPAKHFVTPYHRLKDSIKSIKEELEERLVYFRNKGKLLEAQRIEMRTKYDIEMMEEIGFCSGIENYSRFLSNREPGEKPSTLIDYFPDDYLLIIDESHVTIPQVRGMYFGDRARKENLVEFGFRLPSALDNRPLNFGEFESVIKNAMYMSATPSAYELDKSNGVVVEQVIRPTGLMDPEIDVRPIKGQIDDLVGEINKRADRKERVLVTTLTKRMSEDLTDYLAGVGIRVRYLHSEIDVLDRVAILRDLRLAEFDVLVGINLLREGLDLPEVSLVAVLDADKEGFLRSGTSLIQTAGRAARNVAGRVIFYADKITDSMQKAIDETNRRRIVQGDYNKEHNITPTTIYKSVADVLSATRVADAKPSPYGKKSQEEEGEFIAEWLKLSKEQQGTLLEELEQDMLKAATSMEFEKAAEIRDRIDTVQEDYLSLTRKDFAAKLGKLDKKV
jgi:excinuclease ABC subunit B